MEKFSQFRDRGSGISPFIPATTSASLPSTLLYTLIFLIRAPLFVPFALLCVLPLSPILPAFLRKLLLWFVLFIPGIWWVDLQLDNVKRGSLSQQPPSRVPQPGSIIAANFTSPIDAIYLAAVFDPVFVATYPGTRKVRRISLLSAVLAALSGAVPTSPPTGKDLTTLKALRESYPNRILAVFPENGTTNGKGILPLSPGLISAPVDALIFPVSIRYTPPDITTPVPGDYLGFLWRLLGRPTHTIRVRIAEGIHNTAHAVNGIPPAGTAERRSSGGDEAVTAEEQNLLDAVGEALARLGRVKRVGLTLKDKKAFVAAWNKKGSR